MRHPAPPPIFVLCVDAMVALHELAPVARWVGDPWRWLGALPCVAGGALGVWALVRAGTPVGGAPPHYHHFWGRLTLGQHLPPPGRGE